MNSGTWDGRVETEEINLFLLILVIFPILFTTYWGLGWIKMSRVA